MRPAAILSCLPRTSIVMFLIGRAAWAATPAPIMVDDSDPTIQFQDFWTHDPVNDPANFNYEGTITFSNTSGSSIRYPFFGTMIAVYGSFQVTGTFNLKSTYSIDGGSATTFLPPGTITQPLYRQRFFVSNTLADGEHSLVVTNLGNQYWFDYFLVMPGASASQAPVSPSSTPSTPPTTSSSSSLPPAESMTNTAQDTPPTTSAASPSSPGQTASNSTLPTEPSSSATSQSINTSSSNNATTLTSRGSESFPATAPATATSDSGAQSLSETSTFSGSSTAGTPTSRATVHVGTLAPGALAAIVVGAVVIVLALLSTICWHRRRNIVRVQTQTDITPFDPGLTALAEKELLARSRESSTSTASMLLHNHNHDGAPPYSPVVDDDDTCSAADGTSVHSSQRRRSVRAGTDGPVSRDALRSSGTAATHGFEPLYSPSSPLIPRRFPSGQSGKDSPITPTTEWRSHSDVTAARRRSVDGGVRIAGGPPSQLAAADFYEEEEVRSQASTLPPLYQFYPVS